MRLRGLQNEESGDLMSYGGKQGFQPRRDLQSVELMTRASFSDRISSLSTGSEAIFGDFLAGLLTLYVRSWGCP